MKPSKDPVWFNSFRRWFRRVQLQALDRKNRLQPPCISLDFRKLERRRVFAVDAFFVGGALSIELSGTAHNSANLLSDGTHFFVDGNNNFRFDPTDPYDPTASGEVSGLISDLESITVVGQNSNDCFFWGGDFSHAPLTSAHSVNAVTIQNVEHVEVQANFHAIGNVSIEACNSIEFNSKFQVDGNLLASVGQTGSITDGVDSCVKVHGDLVLNGGSRIELADDASNFWKIDGLTNVNADGSVELGTSGYWNSHTLSVTATELTIHEFDDVTLGNLFVSGDVSIGTGGSICDTANSVICVDGSIAIQGKDILLANDIGDTLHVDGNSVFHANDGDLNIGDAGNVKLGDIIACGNDVTIYEDDDISLKRIETTGGFFASASGAITDTYGAQIHSNQMQLRAGTNILLADDSTDVIQTTGAAFLRACGNIEVQSAGMVQFGSLGMVATDANVYEDDSTHLDGTIVRSLQLHSHSLITQSGVDTGAGTKYLEIANDARLDLDASPGSIQLQRSSSMPPSNVSDGPWMNNSIGGVFSATGVQGDFLIRNVSPTATLGTITGTFRDFSVWHTDNAIILPDQLLAVSRDLTLIAGVDVEHPNHIGTAELSDLHSTDTFIEDRGTRIDVSGAVRIVAGGYVSLSDSSNESLAVLNGSTSLVSLGGKNISIGPLGDTRLSQIGFFTESLVDGSRGNVMIQLDQSTTLTNPTLPCPDGRTLSNTARNVVIEIAGGLDSLPGTTMTVQEDLNINATDAISIFNDSNDSLRVTGPTRIESLGANITIGSAGLTQLEDVTLLANQGDIVVGGIGKTVLGSISAYANNIGILEDASMTIRGAFANANLLLTSSLNILSTEAYSLKHLTGISADRAFITAGTSAHLGVTNILKLNVSVGSNDELSNSSLFEKNAVADSTGQLYLNAIGTNLPAGVLPASQTLNGESMEELRARASFVDSFENRYGLYIRNNTTLTVESAYNRGDGIHSYVETIDGEDLIIAGKFEQKFTGTDSGGIVLISGEQLEFTPDGRLIIESINGDPSTNRTISQSALTANAFDGNRGPSGFESTQDVLYASDAISDTATQNVLQRTSTQFGVAGESGFQTLVQYADGNSQLFGNRQDLYASFLNGSSSPFGTGVLVAHSSASGDAAVFERNVPYANTFLGTYQTLPTTAIFRRSEEFFMFSNAGRTDSAISKLDLTQVVDDIGEVYAPGRKISFSLPNQIIVTPLVGVPAQFVSIGTNVVYPDLSNDAEPRVVSDATTEVSIMRVGFADIDDDGQVSDSELPDRGDIQIVAITSHDNDEDKSDTNENLKGTQKKRLGHGELDLATKDIKGPNTVTTADIEKWIAEYRNDPSKPSGAYAIISVDNLTGVKVLEVFGTRDFEVSDSDAKQDSSGLPMSEGVPINPVPLAPNEESSNTKQEGVRNTSPSRETSRLDNYPIPKSFLEQSLEPASENQQYNHGFVAVGALAAAGIQRMNTDPSVSSPLIPSPSTSQSRARFSRLARRLRLVQKEVCDGTLS